MFSFMEASMPLRSSTVAGFTLLILLTTFLRTPFFFFLTAGTEEGEEEEIVWLDFAATLFLSLLNKPFAAFVWVFIRTPVFLVMFFLMIFPNSSIPSPSKPFKYCRSIG